MTYINNIYIEFPVVFLFEWSPPQKKNRWKEQKHLKELSAAIVGLLLCQVAERAAQVGSVDELSKVDPQQKEQKF